MLGAAARQAVPALFLLLLASAPPPPGVAGSAGERRPLLELLLQAVGEPPRGDRLIARRYGAADPEPRGTVASAAAREPRLLAAAAASRHVEIFPRDSNLKDKFIKHFTGPVSFSAECSKHFHRLYHNTRDCSTPAYYKRCARLLTRLAMSPLCTQP